MLSGGKSARLTRRLVREERIAQDVMIATLPGVGGASAVLGWATVRPGVDPAAVEAAYLEELARLAAEPPTEDEMVRARALTEADELGALARVEERAERLSMYATLFDDPGMVNTILGRYLSVTAEQIRDVAKRVFREDNRAVLTYLPVGGAPLAGEEGPSDEVGPADADDGVEGSADADGGPTDTPRGAAAGSADADRRLAGAAEREAEA